MLLSLLFITFVVIIVPVVFDIVIFIISIAVSYS